jgi:hypothetical protein
MITIRTVLLAAIGIAAVCVPPAAAQPASPGAVPGRVELAIGPLWIGHQALGSSNATETTSSGGNLTLFSTSTDLAARAGVEGRVGVRISRAFEVEASGTYATPQLRSQISNDFEGAAPITAAEQLQQFTVTGGIVWYPAPESTSRLAPFVTAGAGYLRQLHESATLAENGQFYQVGGGVKYLFASRPASRLKGLGVRFDARAVARSKGVAFDDRRSFSPALGASIYARF